MRIFYDGAIYGFDPLRGISRYFANIISKLPDDYTPTLTSYTDSSEIHYPSHKRLKVFEFNKKLRPIRFNQRLKKYYFKAVSKLNRFDRMDIVHPTYYSLISVSRQDIKAHKIPIVLTVYDMIHEIFSDTMDPTGYNAIMKRRAILSADKIICISESTKKDLLERIPLPEDKVTVTYLASELDASQAYGSELVPSRPYYLYVGSRAPYKNFDGLLSAFAKVVSVKPDLCLCVVNSPFNQAEEKLIEQLNLKNNVEYYGQVSDSHLAKLYRCSIAFVYPSLYEGFGIPPLEAMSCGTAVVAANCSSIPEVVGDAGILFDPHSINDLADILLTLHDNPSERERLIARGYERTQIFSWEKTVAETIDVYRSVNGTRK